MTTYVVPPWMVELEKESNLDTREIPGAEDNPNIVRYHQSCTLKATDDETPWCSALANTVIQNCGLGYKGTQSAQAISWLKWGKSIDGRYGAITVFDHGNGTGHVTFFLYAEGDTIYCRGGNQGDQIKISAYNLQDVADFRWPNSFADQGGYG